MNPRELSLIRASFAALAPVADQAAALFQARLFELDPALRDRVSGDMREQGRQLVDFLGAVIAELDHVDTLVPAVRTLSLRLGSGSVTAVQCVEAAHALLWTLEKCLGPRFTPAVREAWAGTCSLLANILVDADRPTAHAA